MRNNRLSTNIFVLAKLSSEAGTAYKLIGCANSFSDSKARTLDNVSCQGTGDVMAYAEGKQDYDFSLSGFHGVPTSGEATANRYADYFEDALLTSGGVDIDLKLIQSLSYSSPVAGDKVKELKNCKISKYDEKHDHNSPSTYDVSGKYLSVVKSVVA